MTPLRKTEKAFATDVLTAARFPGLADWLVTPGLSATRKSLPRVEVVCLQAAPEEGFEGLPEAREYESDLELVFIDAADDGDEDARDELDDLVSSVQDWIEGLPDGSGGIEALQTLLNKPASGPDERTVQGYYVYGLYLSQLSQEPEEKGNWKMTLAYRLKFRADDGDGPA